MPVQTDMRGKCALFPPDPLSTLLQFPQILRQRSYKTERLRELVGKNCGYLIIVAFYTSLCNSEQNVVSEFLLTNEDLHVPC